jgi:hypothetical protein
MVEIQERLGYARADILVAKQNLDDAIGQLLSNLAEVRERLREVKDDPETAGVSSLGIVQGKGGHIDSLCGQIEMGVKQYRRMRIIALMAE